MTELGRSTLFIAQDRMELAHMAASFLLTHAKAALNTAPWFNLALSGGRTPRDLYETLAFQHRKAIPWERVRFFWTDERNVPPDHPDSNYRMAKETLLDPLRIAHDQIFRIPTELASADEAAETYEKLLRRLFAPLNEPRFDFTLLGLGEDGHTASLFPEAEAAWTRAEYQGRWACALWVPHLRAHRITLLPGALSASRTVLFLVSGDSKARILKEVLEREPNQPITYPAQRISPANRPLWLADRAAASLALQDCVKPPESFGGSTAL